METPHPNAAGHRHTTVPGAEGVGVPVHEDEGVGVAVPDDVAVEMAVPEAVGLPGPWHSTALVLHDVYPGTALHNAAQHTHTHTHTGAASHQCY